MSYVAAAVAGSAVIGAVASSISGSKAAKAQKQAADQATQVQREQNAEATREYDLQRSDLAPYRSVGTGALYQLSNLMGIAPAKQASGSSAGTDWGAYVQGNPDALAQWQGDASERAKWNGDINAFGEFHYNNDGARRDLSAFQTGANGQGQNPAEFGAFNKPFTLADFNKDPGYEFRRAEGQKGVEASAAARGGILSGGTLKALDRYNQDYASQEYGTAYNRYNNDLTTRFNRLSSLAGTGQTATNTGVAASQANVQQQQAGANNISNNIAAAGNARASQYVNTGNAVGNAAGQVGNYFALKSFMGNGGGGGFGGGVTPAAASFDRTGMI